MGPDAGFNGAFHNLQNDADMRSVLHSAELFGLAEKLFGEPAGCLDYRWVPRMGIVVSCWVWACGTATHTSRAGGPAGHG